MTDLTKEDIKVTYYFDNPFDKDEITPYYLKVGYFKNGNNKENKLMAEQLRDQIIENQEKVNEFKHEIIFLRELNNGIIYSAEESDIKYKKIKSELEKRIQFADQRIRLAEDPLIQQTELIPVEKLTEYRNDLQKILESVK